MKKGFTLIELLAVIVILSIIAVIATPIIINIIEDTRENANKRSIDLYARAVENAIVRYQTKENKKPKSYDDIKDYIEYDGNEVECDTFRIYEDSTFYLNNCKVNNVLVKNYSYGKTTLAKAILYNYGEANAITEIDPNNYTETTTTGNSVYIGSSSYYYGTSYTFKDGLYTLSGTLTSSTTTECRNGTKECGKYTLKYKTSTSSGTILYEITDFGTSGDYVTANTPKTINEFGKTTDIATGLYKTSDDYGDSYYFRGDVINNYVQFGAYAAGSEVNGTTYDVKTPIYWRIVRINGDGTVKLVYDGTEKVTNGESHTATIADTIYNNGYDAAKYVAYTYDTSDTDTTQVDSTIKGVVDKWYADNLEQNYGQYIADIIFCNDREITGYHDTWGNTGITTTEPTTTDYNYSVIYGASARLRTNYKRPALTCTNQSDRYTVDDTKNGNGYLTYPIGLLTADEVIFAGGTNTSYYLYSGSSYWTFSPYAFNYFYYDPTVLIVDADGTLSANNVYNNGTEGVRPVINLKADVEFTGSGTLDDPYVIVTE